MQFDLLRITRLAVTEYEAQKGCPKDTPVSYTTRTGEKACRRLPGGEIQFEAPDSHIRDIEVSEGKWMKGILDIGEHQFKINFEAPRDDRDPADIKEGVPVTPEVAHNAWDFDFSPATKTAEPGEKFKITGEVGVKGVMKLFRAFFDHAPKILDALGTDAVTFTANLSEPSRVKAYDMFMSPKRLEKVGFDLVEKRDDEDTNQRVYIITRAGFKEQQRQQEQPTKEFPFEEEEEDEASRWLREHGG